MIKTLVLTLNLLWLLPTIADGQKLSIMPQGPHTKKINTGMIFTCSIVEYRLGDATPIMKWIGSDGLEISTTTGRIFVERDDSRNLRLYITRIQPEDAGTLSCECQVDGETLTEPVDLRIFKSIEFDEKPTLFRHEIGDDALLECTARGEPMPTVSWRHNRHKIPPDTIKYRYEHGGLRIYSVTPSDNGTYECRAEVTSQGLINVRPVNLDVMYSPLITKAPNSTTVIKGNTLTLKCEAHGNPAVNFQWFREQKVSTIHRVKVPLDSHLDILTISHVTETDVGRYFCRVTNDLGSKEVYADVHILVPPEVNELPHRVVLEGDTVMMPCEASGIPTPVITWKEAGSEIEYRDGSQPEDARIRVDRGQPEVPKLIIHNVQRTYAGKYTCIARNEAGWDQKNGTLRVEYLPTANVTETRQFGWAGEKRNFTCIGSGLPKPKLNWFRDAQYLSNGGVYNIQTNHTQDRVISTLQINIEAGKPSLYGGYNCIAKNKHGHVTKSIYLREAKSPGMPEKVSVVKETPTSVTLSAESPSGSKHFPITSWRVEIERQVEYEYERTERETIFFGTADKMLIKNLEPDTVYTFHLSVSNVVGFGTPAKIKVHTKVRELGGQADLPVDTVEAPPEDNLTRVQDRPQRKVGESVQSDVVQMSTTPIGIIIGITVVVGILLVMVIVALLWWRKRSNSSGFPVSDKKRRRNKEERTSKDLENIPLERNHINSVPNPNYAKSPREQRKNGVKPGTMNGAPATGEPLLCESPQQQAWDTMMNMIQAQNEHQGRDNPPEPPGEPDRDDASYISDLPPPPPFLLENGTEGDVTSYDDVLEGYHSEDNVDDGHYEIRVPSMYEKS